MTTEINIAKKWFANKFENLESVPNGVYAIPMETSKGSPFMRIEIKDACIDGKYNFLLFQDEQLTVSWFNGNKVDF